MPRRTMPVLEIPLPEGVQFPAKTALQRSRFPCWPIYRLGIKETLAARICSTTAAVVLTHYDQQERRTLPCTLQLAGKCDRCAHGRGPEQAAYLAVWLSTHDKIHLLHIPRLALIERADMLDLDLYGREIRVKRHGMSIRGRLEIQSISDPDYSKVLPPDHAIQPERIRDVLCNIWRIKFVNTAN